MDTTKYEAFLKVTESKSLTEAARILGYTQPGITRMINTLESELGFPLFSRSKHGVQLTENGREMLPFIRRIVQDQQQIKEMSAAICGMLRGTLTIGCYWSISACLLPGILKDFLQEYPQIHIRLKEGTNTELARLLQERAVDLCFAAKPAADIVCDWLPVLQDELRVWLPKDHPYAKKESFPLAKLGDYPFIITQPEQDTDIDRLLHKAGVKADIRFATTDGFSTYCMVEAGLGISLNQALITRRWQGNVVTLPFDPPQYIDLGLAVPSLKEASPAARRFIACVQKQRYAPAL